MAPARKPLADRFWAKVRKTDGDGCWEWSAFRNPRGYGTMGLGSRSDGKEFSHRVSWIVHFGPIPDGLCVLHRCDNPPCVRPDHLFLGSMADNTADMVAKGRLVRGRRHLGSAHHKAKISEATIATICELRRGGHSQSQIGAKVGLTQASVSGILRGAFWTHVPRPAWFSHEPGKYHRKRPA